MAQIIVPRDAKAMIDFDTDEATANQLITVFYKDNDPGFKALWGSGIFEKINAVAGTLIDLYEEEGIENMQSIDAILASGIFGVAAYPEAARGGVSRLYKMFEEAKSRKTGIYFYF